MSNVLLLFLFLYSVKSETTYLLVRNSSLHLVSPTGGSHLISHNTTSTFTATPSYIYYVRGSGDIDTVYEYSLSTQQTRPVSTNHVSISGLSVNYPTLFILEIGNYYSSPVLSSFSLQTGELVTLWEISGAGDPPDPRSLYLDRRKGLLYFGLSNGRVMGHNIASTETGLVTSSYDVWPTGLCSSGQVLYMYNSRELISHDLRTGLELGRRDVTGWNTEAVTGTLLCSINSVNWRDEGIELVQLNSTLLNEIPAVSFIDNVMELPTAEEPLCGACNVCASGRCLCGSQLNCSIFPDDFLLLTQTRAISILSLSDPARLKKLHISTEPWWLRQVQYDPVSGQLFWIESVFVRRDKMNARPVTSRIMSMFISDTFSRKLLYSVPPESSTQIDSLAVSPSDGTVFWLEAEAQLIYTVGVTCQRAPCLRKTVVSSEIDTGSTNLEVSSSAGYMVYLSNDNAIIRRDLDGGNPKIILSSNILQITSISLSGSTVYILCSNNDKRGSVISLPVSGGEQITVFRQKKEFVPISFTLQYNDVYVLSALKQSITKVGLSTDTSAILMSNLKGLRSVAGSSLPVAGSCGGNNCELFCFSLPYGNYKCGCADGYILKEDGLTCQHPPTLYLGVGSWVQRFVPFSSADRPENVIYHPGAEIIALDFIATSGTLVWIDGAGGTISKAIVADKALPLLRRIDIVTEGLAMPTDVSVDWVSGTVFWSDQLRDSISVTSLDGKVRRVIVEHALEPTSLVTNPHLGLVYWVGWGRDSALVRSASMEGRNVTTLYTGSDCWPTDISLDYLTGAVVWVDAKRRVVATIPADGSAGPSYIVGTRYMIFPTAIATWHHQTYWVEERMSAVFVAEGPNANNVDMVMDRLRVVSDISLSHPSKEGTGGGCGLDNGGCSHVCVPLPSGRSTCFCPSHMSLPAPDRRQCLVLPQRFIGTRLNPYLYTVGSPPARLSHQRLHNALQIAVHYTTQTIFWLESVKSSIEAVHVNGTGYRVVYQSTYTPTDLQVDWLGGNLFWSEADTRCIKCVTLSGRLEKLIVLTVHPPQFLALDPANSLLFWIECEEGEGPGWLYKSSISGENQTMIVETPSCPDSVAIARQADINSVFWNIADKLYQYRYSLKQIIPARTLPFPTQQILWNEDNLFLLRSNTSSSSRSPGDPPHSGAAISKLPPTDTETSGQGEGSGRVLVSIDRVISEVELAVDGASFLVVFSPLETGYSDCQVDNGGCTHFCFHSAGGGEVRCECPAEQLLLPDSRTCSWGTRECPEFRCGSGECLPEDLVCSGNPECVDGSDEEGCGWCRSYEFACGSTCLGALHVCDGTVDCEGGQDEEMCAPCTKDSGVVCKSTGTCLPRSMKCNGVKECPQGEDERKCPERERVCNALEWRCEDGSCIHKTWLCDLSPDCANGEDERDCAAECDPVTQFDCGHIQCIPISERCDGFINCLKDGQDELGCDLCKAGQSRCENGQCRATSRWCDHVFDCSDRSDERGCNYTIVNTGQTGAQTHVVPTLVIILGALVMSMCIVLLLYKMNVLPRIRSSYKHLTQSTNKTVETNVCVTTNTYSELDTTVCSSDVAWQRRHNRSTDPYETMTTSSVTSSLKPIHMRNNAYERFGIIPVQSVTDVSVADGPAPSVVSGGGYSSGPSQAPSARSRAASRALSGRSLANSARSRAHVQYHVNNNVIWDENINSVSDYDNNYMSDNNQSELSVGFHPGRRNEIDIGMPTRPQRLLQDLVPSATPITTDIDE